MRWPLDLRMMWQYARNPHGVPGALGARAALGALEALEAESRLPRPALIMMRTTGWLKKPATDTECDVPDR